MKQRLLRDNSQFGAVALPSDFSIAALGVLTMLVGLGKSYVQPDYMLALQQHYGFQVRHLGWIASGENAAIAIGCIAGGLFQRHVTGRVMLIVAAIAMLGNFASLFARDFQSIMALRVITGLLGEGPLGALCYTVIASARNSERALAIAVTAEGVMGSIVLWLEPHLVKIAGPTAMLLPYGLIAGVIVLWMALGGRVPHPGEKHASATLGERGAGASIAPALIILTSIVVLTAAASGMWTFTATAAGSIGATPDVIARALSVGTFFGIAGTILPAFVGNRFGWSIPVVICSLGTVLSAYLLMQDGSFLTIAASAMVLQTFWGMNVTYMATGLMQRDIGGRFVAFASIASIAGSAIGASTFSWLIDAHGYGAMVPSVAAGSVAAALIFVVGMTFRAAPARRAWRPETVPAE